MVVHTRSERVDHARRMVLEFLGSSVDLSLTANVAEWNAEYGADPDRYGTDAATVAQPVKVDNDLYVRDYAKCILCYQCVDACGEQWQQSFVIDIAGRGFDAHVSTEHDVALPDSACVYCGNCIQVCPTGALMPTTEFDMRASGIVGRGTPDRHRNHLRVLRGGLHAGAPRAGQHDRQGHLTGRQPDHPRQPVHQGPLRLPTRPEPPAHRRRLTATSGVRNAQPCACRTRVTEPVREIITVGVSRRGEQEGI